MAGWAIWFDLDQDGVSVTIDEYFFKMEIISTGFTFGPQFLATSRPECDQAGIQSDFNRLLIHPANH